MGVVVVTRLIILMVFFSVAYCQYEDDSDENDQDLEFDSGERETRQVI